MDIFAAMKAVFIGVALLGGVLLSIFAPRRYHDTPVEEAAEKVIEVLTGQDIDITPASPEDAEPEDFVETFSDDQEGCLEDNWDTYFDEYNKVKDIIASEEGFPLEKILP